MVKKYETTGNDSFYSGAVSSLAPDATATGKTLPTLKGSALLTGLRYVILTVVSGTVTFGYGSISGTSPALPEPFGRPITKALADTLKLFSTAGAVVTLEEYV